MIYDDVDPEVFCSWHERRDDETPAEWFRRACFWDDLFPCVVEFAETLEEQAEQPMVE